MKEHAPLAVCFRENCIEAGCDEAGRGCLAGPVFAAAVILPSDFYCEKLNDSKQLSEKERDELRPIIEKNALCYAVDYCMPQEIDEINILWASVRAMHKSLAKLSQKPQHILVDGNRFRPFEDISYTLVVKGDSKYMSIAAASVLAKTYRDEYMQRLHTRFPVYNWECNKGYPTKHHRQAIKEYGITEYHRKSFHLFEKQLEIEFDNYQQ